MLIGLLLGEQWVDRSKFFSQGWALRIPKKGFELGHMHLQYIVEFPEPVLRRMCRRSRMTLHSDVQSRMLVPIVLRVCRIPEFNV